MPRSKGKKTDIPPPLVGQKRHRKPTAKALPPPPPPPPPPKPPKIKLTTAPRPLPELSPDTSPTRASPEKEVFIEIPSSSSEESPEPEKKTHMVTVNWQVYLNHKLVHAEAFQEDFLCSLHHPYRHWKSWIHMKAEDAAKTDKEVKARKKWKALYGPMSNRLIFHIEDRESFERFEHMMVSRGSRGVDCALEARFVTKGDPESSPILDRTSGKRRKIPDPPKLVYSDDDSDAKKSVPPIKKPRKSATTVAVESLVEERKDQSQKMDRLSQLSQQWRCNRGEKGGCPNKNRQCFVNRGDHFRIELEDFHFWIDQWKEDLSTDANLRTVPTDLIIKWIQNGENQQRIGGRRIESKGKAKAKEGVKHEQREGSSQPPSSIINHNYYGDKFKGEEPSTGLYSVPRVPPPRRSPIYTADYDPIPPPEFVAIERASRRRAELLHQQNLLRHPRASSPYFQRRRPSPPSLPAIPRPRYQAESSSAFDMRALRESSPIRRDTDIEEELASFRAWLDTHLPRNRRADISNLIGMASEEQIDPKQLKAIEKSEAKEHGIPWGFLLVVKDQVSPWRTVWNSEVNRLSRSNIGAPVPIANMGGPSHSTIPDTQAGDSIPPDVIFSTYPEDEISFYQGEGNSQKQDWEDFMSPSLFGEEYGSIEG